MVPHLWGLKPSMFTYLSYLSTLVDVCAETFSASMAVGHSPDFGTSTFLDVPR